MADPRIHLMLGWRNLWLHPLRTLLTALALAAGIAGLTFLSALNDGWMQQVRVNFALTMLGHIQIHARGFEQSRRLGDRIPQPAPLLQALRAMPEIASATMRVRVSGLASSAHGNGGAVIYGIDPRHERATTRLASFVREGRWLKAADERGVLLGAGLADRLGVRLGDKVVLTAATPAGDIASEVFRVRGLLRSGVMEVDEILALAPVRRVQHWLGIGDGVTDIVLRARDFRMVERLAAHLRDRFAADAASAPLEVLTWSEIDPMARQWAEFADAYTWLVLAIVILIVLAEVLNTMLMSMRERTRELGLMGALGMSRGAIFTMVMGETIVLVALGAGAGLAAGTGLVWWSGAEGIDLSRFAAALSFTYMDPVIHPALRAESVIRILAATLAGALLAGLPPAWRAASLEPAVALRSIE